ncbi:MAG: BlaI/MecI/CopY family transcriptional regulator [Clostridiales bacterium]|nr:BlaI/MecI/CopY family transcriptional regulator [Clostridiales bacterium]
MIRLSDSEWKIATYLWDNGSMTITELTKVLSSETGWQKNTVITLLKRMEEKNAVSHNQDSRAKSFYMQIDRTEAEIEETESFLDKVYSGNVGLMISNLVRSDKLSKDDIEELLKILEER